MALVLLLIRLDRTDTASSVILAAGLLGLHVVRGVYSIPTLHVAERRRLPWSPGGSTCQSWRFPTRRTGFSRCTPPEPCFTSTCRSWRAH
ncbi:hypothetical protein ACFQX6_56975 [Streptosporangium lutulentum]